MPSRLAVASVVALSGWAAACGSKASENDSKTGVWRLARTVTSQPAGCPTLAATDLQVVIDPRRSPILSGRDQPLFEDGQPYDGGALIKFSTREQLSGAARPVIIHHDLALTGSQLAGTGFADGDGTCHYTLTMVATRE